MRDRPSAGVVVSILGSGAGSGSVPPTHSARASTVTVPTAWSARVASPSIWAQAGVMCSAGLCMVSDCDAGSKPILMRSSSNPPASPVMASLTLNRSNDSPS
jgi:hypothetical protein